MTQFRISFRPLKVPPSLTSVASSAYSATTASTSFALYALRNSWLTCTPGSGLDSAFGPDSCAHVFKLNINNTVAMRFLICSSPMPPFRLYVGVFTIAPLIG